MFTPVDPAIKERIVSAFLAGQGRNQIDRELRKEGIQVSHGSISNVIIKYKKEHEQLLQKDTKVNDASTVAPPQPSQGPPEAGANISTSFPIKKTGSPSLPGLAHGVGLTETVADKNDYNTRVATHPEEGPDELQFKEDSDISLEDHIITNTKDWQENGYRLEGSQKGGPLSWFRNGSTKESEKDPPPSSIPPEVNVNNNDYNNNNNYVIKEDAALKEKERIDKCQPAAPDSEDKRPPIVIKRERYQRHHEPPSLSIAQDNEPIISLGIDWDSDTLWEKKFIHYIMEDKKQRQYQLQLIEQQQAALNQQRQELEVGKQQMAQWNNDLKVREMKLNEVELIIPLARQLQAMKVDVTNFLPWIENVQEYASNHNTDLTTAAFDIMKNLKIWKNLQVLQNTIKKAEERLSVLGPLIRGKEAAITTIISLQRAGFTKKQIIELTNLVNNWNIGLSHNNGNNGGKQLDPELISIGRS